MESAYFRAQGATEYLVILAVVLIIALVGIALLGFFPGTASEAQISESQAYWRSANPISIVETVAPLSTNPGESRPVIRVRNNGLYRLQITKMISGSTSVSMCYDSQPAQAVALSSLPQFMLSPGEEKTILGSRYYVYVYAEGTGTSSQYNLYGAQSVCPGTYSSPPASPGYLSIRDLGFEYIEYVEGQSVLKRQSGENLVVRCNGA